MSEQLTHEQDQAETQHRLVRFLDKIHAEEALGTPEARADFLQNMTFDQYEVWLTRVNGIVRELPTSTRSMDGRGVIEASSFLGWSTIEYVPPAREDRRPLMEEAFSTAKTIRDPEAAATMLGLVTNIVHPFNDGNGRTSRLQYTLMTHGYDGSPEDKRYFSDILENVEGRKLVDLDPTRAHLDYRITRAASRRTAEKYGYEIGKSFPYTYSGYDAEFVDDQAPENLKVAPHVSKAARGALHAILSDTNFGGPIMFEFMNETGRTGEEYIRQFKDTDGAVERTVMEMDKVVPELSDEDIVELAHRFNAFKRYYAGQIIEAFTDPGAANTARRIVEFYRPQSTES